MSPTCQILVVADDMTGAADTGVQFCPAVGPVYMASAEQGDWLDAAVETEAVSVFTHTRHLDSATAAKRVRMAARRTLSLAPRQIYKKIDSCLRGNPGAEIEALLQATGAAASFVAPAFPLQGRTTVDDVHLVHGVPVAETEIGRDPRTPVHESRLSALLAAQSRLPVGHVDLACIESGRAGLAERVRHFLDRGCRHIAFDAVHSAHLDVVAALARDRFERILLAGSAGLADSLARIMARELTSPIPAVRPRIEKWLLVCGSASRILADQAVQLARATGWTHLTLDPSCLSAIDGPRPPEPCLAQLADQWGGGGLILSVTPIQGVERPEPPERVVRGLASVTAALLRMGTADAVFLSGGDTAEAVWRRLGAAALLIREEILPGLVRGTFMGSHFDGFPVVTKAGAFGSPDTLNRLIGSLK